MQVTTIEQFDIAAVALSDAREGLVKGAKSTGNLINKYAAALCTMFDVLDDKAVRVTAWYELKGKAKTGVKAEREAFASAMNEAGFGKGTTDVYWQRVKEASGYVTAGNRVSGGSNIDDKTTAELKTMLNRIFKAEEEGDSTCNLSSEIKGQLLEMFEFMGGDVDSIG
jgi:hypothetical protein